MRVQTASLAASSGAWTRIEYRDYWDFARCFHLTYRNLDLVFDAPFLEIADEYSDYFVVYKGSLGEGDVWFNRYRDWGISHIVPVDSITLDETKRQYISKECLDRMFQRYEWAR